MGIKIKTNLYGRIVLIGDEVQEEANGNDVFSVNLNSFSLSEETVQELKNYYYKRNSRTGGIDIYLAPTLETELLGQSVSEREIQEIVQGQQISDLEIRLLLGGVIR